MVREKDQESQNEGAPMHPILIYEKIFSQQVNICEKLLEEGTAVWWRWWLFVQATTFYNNHQKLVSLMLPWVS